MPVVALQVELAGQEGPAHTHWPVAASQVKPAGQATHLPEAASQVVLGYRLQAPDTQSPRTQGSAQAQLRESQVAGAWQALPQQSSMSDPHPWEGSLQISGGVQSSSESQPGTQPHVVASQ